ncbi:MAG: hypothetical protein C5B59_14350 [Bacteroidetes bacterium]|nr:MAG: hypothetical protein C5B59_14350 [Bacteroidota bacterium]
MNDALTKEFTDQAIRRINQNTEKISACLPKLEEKDVWRSPNQNLNSVGNLILHLCGNVRQHIISALGGVKDIRTRNLEFSTKGGLTKEELLSKLQQTIQEATAVIAKMKIEDLLKKRIAQGILHSGVDSILHVTEHYSYHTGQIILLTKLFKNVDMEFYAGIDLNKHNA